MSSDFFAYRQVLTDKLVICKNFKVGSSVKKMRQILLLYIGLLFLLPCVLIILFQKDKNSLFTKMESVERYLPGVLYEVIDSEMQLETLKAQAVIIRSNIIYALEKEKITYEELQKEYSVIEKNMEIEDVDFYDRLIMACQETEGEAVLYDSKVCYCPYFYSSNGVTRDAFSFFEDGSYPYVIAVPSHRDEESNSYITYHHFSMVDFTDMMNELSDNTYQNQIEILENDESEYITWIKIGESIVGGEVFRKELGLASACFSIEQKNEGIRITCKGRGHGFGFSQYGANAMAIDGKEYKELLNYYFHNIKIENVYRFS